MVGRAGNTRPGTLRIVSKIVAEAISDANEIPPEIAEFYMKQLSGLIFWVATGEWNSDTPKPEDFTGE